MQPEKSRSLVFRQRLADRIAERGLTQVALARAVGVSHVTINNYLRGIRSLPRAEELLALARVLEVTMEWLLGAGVERGESAPEVSTGGGASVGQPSSLCAVPEPELRELARRLREQADQLEKHCAGTNQTGGK